MKIKYIYDDTYNECMDAMNTLIGYHEHWLLNDLQENTNLSNKEKSALFLGDMDRNRLLNDKFEFQCKAIPTSIKISKGT